MKFEQQSRESNKAFAAFKTYLDLGPERSLAAVAKKLGKSKSAIATWSRKHHWQDRLAELGTTSTPSPFGLSTINHQPFSNSQPPSSSVPSVISCKIPSPMPWDQQPRETNKNFAAFTAYLTLGPGRSLTKTAEATGRTRDQLAHWSQRWRWRARAAAYHAHLAAVERKATEQLIAEKSHDWAKMHEGIKRQAWAEAEDLIALAQDFKARWRDSDRLPEFGALIRALDLAFKLKQFAAGMPSEVKEVHTNITGTVELEWEAALRKAYGPKKESTVIDAEELPSTPKPQLANPATTPAPDPEP